MSRTSEIEFQPFENTWVVETQERQQLGVVKSIAVMPFVVAGETERAMMNLHRNS